MLTDKERIMKTLISDKSFYITFLGGEYYLVKRNTKLYIHKSTFDSCKLTLTEFSNNKWRL